MEMIRVTDSVKTVDFVYQRPSALRTKGIAVDYSINALNQTFGIPQYHNIVSMFLGVHRDMYVYQIGNR